MPQIVEKRLPKHSYVFISAIGHKIVTTVNDKTYTIFTEFQQIAKVFPTNFNMQTFKLILFLFSKTMKVYSTL